MRKIQLAFLTFLVAVPSLMCFMAFCPMQTAQANEHVSCHEMVTSGEDQGIMLMSDCMGVDFYFQSISDSIDAPTDSSGFLLSAELATHSFQPDQVKDIRGSPPNNVEPAPSSPPYIATQRLRI